MLRVGFALAVLAGLAAPALANPPSPDPKTLAVPNEELSKARELVRQLGSETFAERESAEQSLAAMGRFARAALYDGATFDPDPEVRARCNVLLPRANAIEMKARIETFLADADGRFEHDLPGWNRLRSSVRGEWKMLGWTFTTRPGADKAARELFVEFLKAPGGKQLLTAVAENRSGLSATIAALKQELYNARFGRPTGIARTPGMMEVGVVLFADSVVKSSGGGPRTSSFSTVLTNSGIMQAAQGTDGKAAALRAVLNDWFDSRTDPYEMYMAMNFAAANAQNNDAAARLAIRLLGSAGAPASYRGYAMSTLIRVKPQDHLPAIERLLGDESVATTVSKVVNGKVERTTITVGDMALAAAVVTTGQKLEDYHIEDRLKGSSSTVISYTRYSIPEDKRKDAVAKWKEWRAKNP